MMRVVVGTAQKILSQKSSGRLGAESNAVGFQNFVQEISVSTSNEELASLASTETLFGGAQTFLLRGALADPERGEAILGIAEIFVESPHTFIFEEEKLLKAPTDILKKAGAIIEINKAEKKDKGFDPFGLTAALGARDKKNLWLGLIKSFRAGEKPEAAAGLLAWKARNLLEGHSLKYSRDELKNLSRTIVFLYHDSHRGVGELELLLEKFALTL